MKASHSRLFVEQSPYQVIESANVDTPNIAHETFGQEDVMLATLEQALLGCLVKCMSVLCDHGMQGCECIRRQWCGWSGGCRWYRYNFISS